MKLKNKSVYVRKSLLPGAGLGLFANRNFRKGDRIAEYGGKRRLWREVKHEDGHNGYLLRLNRTMAIDARPTLHLPGRYANDAAGLVRIRGLRNNAEYLIYGDRCFIEATRGIRKGEEILVSYGRAFWALQRKLHQANSR